MTTGFDANVRVQDDLFRHVNGGWIAEAKIPAEYGFFGSFMQLRDNALKDLPRDHRGRRKARRRVGRL